MTAPRLRASSAASAALVAALALSCSRRPPPQGDPPPPSASQPPPPLAAPTLPSAFEALHNRALDHATGLEPLAQTLSDRVAARDQQGSLAALHALRLHERRGASVARTMTKIAASQMGSTDLLDADESSRVAGFRPIERALTASPPDFATAARAAALLLQASKLAPAELEMGTFTLDRLALCVSDATFSFGARLDGSLGLETLPRKPQLVAELEGLSSAISATADAARLRDPSLAADLDRALEALTRQVAAWGDEPSQTLATIRQTGVVGALVRRSFIALGASVRPPFSAYKRPGPEAAVSIATPPALQTKPSPPQLVALGKELFSSRLLSRNGDMACSSCHDARSAFARNDPPTLTFDRKVPARNAPALVNVAHEPQLFWDGRASTLAVQIEIATGKDMGGDFKVISDKVGRDPSLGPRMRAAFGHDPTQADIEQAIAAYERTLVSFETPLDRFVAGDDGAMTPAQHRGFDLFTGKARCSRCHFLPLTSGVLPPRFLFTELSSIGVPTAPSKKQLDPDRGRGAVTRRPRDEGMFKVPSLRNLALTAPYFHNGAFKTLEQVVDFYDKGGGPGLGLEVPNVDPELQKLSLSADEKAALLTFLREGLLDAQAP